MQSETLFERRISRKSRWVCSELVNPNAVIFLSTLFRISHLCIYYNKWYLRSSYRHIDNEIVGCRFHPSVCEYYTNNQSISKYSKEHENQINEFLHPFQCRGPHFLRALRQKIVCDIKCLTTVVHGDSLSLAILLLDQLWKWNRVIHLVRALPSTSCSRMVMLFNAFSFLFLPQTTRKYWPTQPLNKESEKCWLG